MENISYFSKTNIYNKTLIPNWQKPRRCII